MSPMAKTSLPASTGRAAQLERQGIDIVNRSQKNFVLHLQSLLGQIRMTLYYPGFAIYIFYLGELYQKLFACQVNIT